MNAVYYLGPAHGAGEALGQGAPRRRRAGQPAVQRLRAARAIRWRSSSRSPDTTWTPRVLKDGSDSVGALGALNRVYLNIGLFSEEWLLHFRPLLGGRTDHADQDRRRPEELGRTGRRPSGRRRTWRASSSKAPTAHLLKDAPNGASLPDGGRRASLAAASWSSPTAARAATPASSRRCRRDSTSRTATGKGTCAAGTTTGTGRRPTSSRRRCARSSRADDFLEGQLSLDRAARARRR